MVSGLCFFISIFFAPIFASIPPWATGCTLIIVGAMMCQASKDINWKYFGDALPAFVTLAVIPFTYSIAYGLISGIITYMIINTVVWLVELASGGRIVPPEKEFKEPWTYKLQGGLLPAWVVRGVSGKRDFWREDDPMTEAVPAGTDDERSSRGGEVTEEKGGVVGVVGTAVPAREQGKAE